jgi:salicylate biosynthesis isochorismate synthase
MSDLMVRLGTLVRRARLHARATGRPVLVSASESVDKLDPLTMLHAAEQGAHADEDLDALLRAGQAYWANSGSELAIAALGAAATIAPTGADRFGVADRAWRSLLEGALTDDAGIDIPAVGPVLVGGFSFAPEGPHTALWQEFPSTHLIVPSLQLTAAHGKCWLTVTVLVTVDGDTSMPLDTLARVRELALSAPVREGRERSQRTLRRAFTFTDVHSEAHWRGLVGDAIAAIDDGMLEKVVVARAVHGVAPRRVDVIALLEHLRSVHRNAYLFGYWRGERAFVGASPELLVRVAGTDVDASSLAGSARRGATARQDAMLAAELLASAKNRAEHAMVHRALREALVDLCDDVTSSDEPSLLTLPHVHHLHTAVHARLRPGRSLLELAGALHPTPAVGGSPREHALRFLREHEQLDRGWYAAPIGWIGRSGGELVVALRSALVAGHEATLFAGCGIVAGSEPEQELAESEIKLRPMQSALEAVLDEPTAGAAEVESALERRA